MICEEVNFAERKPCGFQVKWVAKGPGYTKFVCGYHRRGYTRVESIQAFAQRG